MRFLTLLCLIALACFAYPMYVIRPFRPQGATELSIALVIRNYGPWIATVCAIAAIALWSKRRRIGTALLALLTCVFAGLTFVNVFEKMFHPVEKPQFLASDQAKVDADDMVMVASVGRESHAYPIRIMGYHHIVNDTLAGEPIVATY